MRLSISVSLRHSLFLLLLLPPRSNPKTQKLVDRFDAVRQTDRHADRHAHLDDRPSFVSSPDRPCKSSLINGRQRTFCNELGLVRVPKLVAGDSTVLHLEGNRLRILRGREFVTLPSLQSLYLNNNELSTVDSSAFEGLINLSELDLSFNKLRQIPTATFVDLSHLQVLKLSGNKFRILRDFSFARLPKLLKLELNGCGVSEIRPDAFSGLVHLQYLQLAKNNLQTLDQMTFTDLRASGILRLLYLYANPWSCDCNLRWLHDWVEEGLITYDVGSSEEKVTLCHSPANLSRKRWSSLHSIQFACQPRLMTSPQERTVVVDQHDTTNFSCTIFLDPPSNPMWFKDERAISRGAIDYHIAASGDKHIKTSTLTIREAGAANTGTYRCYAANSAGNAEMVVNVVVRVRDRMSTASKMERHGTAVVIGVSAVIVVVLFLILFFVHLSHKNDCAPGGGIGGGVSGGGCRGPDGCGAKAERSFEKRANQRLSMTGDCLIYDGPFKYSRKNLNAAGSKSTYQLCNGKQKGKSKGDETSRLHPHGAKSLPRHFRMRGSVDSGAFCFDYESCQTESSHQSARTSHSRRNDAFAELVVVGQETMDPGPSPSSADASQISTSVFDGHALFAPLVPEGSPSTTTTTTSILTQPGGGGGGVANPHPKTRDNYTNLGCYTLKKLMGTQSGARAERFPFNEGVGFAAHTTKYATMNVGAKLIARDRDRCKTIDAKHQGMKHVRLQIDDRVDQLDCGSSSSGGGEDAAKKQSRSRSTQVPTPTEEDSFFPGEYLLAKEREKNEQVGQILISEK